MKEIITDPLFVKAAKLYPKGTWFIQFGLLPIPMQSNGKFKLSSLNPNDVCLDDQQGTYVFQNGVWASKHDNEECEKYMEEIKRAFI